MYLCHTAWVKSSYAFLNLVTNAACLFFLPVKSSKSRDNGLNVCVQFKIDLEKFVMPVKDHKDIYDSAVRNLRKSCYCYYNNLNIQADVVFRYVTN